MAPCFARELRHERKKALCRRYARAGGVWDGRGVSPRPGSSLNLKRNHYGRVRFRGCGSASAHYQRRDWGHRRSTRQVALSSATVELLGDWNEQVAETRPDAWLFPAVTLDSAVRRDNVWRRNMRPKLKKIRLEWATFQVMRRTFATLSKQAGVDAHTRSAQMGNTVDVNENEYAVSSFEDRLAAVRKLEATVVQ
jgi:integrase